MKLFLAACALAVTVPCYGQTAKPTLKDPAAYMKWLRTSPSSEARRLRAEVKAGATELARERAITRAAGLPATPSDLHFPALPPDQNAAGDYARFFALRKKDAPDSAVQAAVDKLISGTPLSEPETALVRGYLKENEGALTVLHRAAAKPRCIFKRDWSLAPANFPDYSGMRQGARLLTYESQMLARDGKVAEAIRNQTLGYRVADHTAEDPVLISYLVAVAIDAITTRGLENILFTNSAGDTPALVRGALRKRSHLSLTHAFRGETVFTTSNVDLIRKGGLSALASAIAAPTEDVRTIPRQSVPLNAQDRALVSGMFDHAEARILRHMRQLTSAMGLPYRESRVKLQPLVNAPEPSQQDMAGALVSTMSPVFELAKETEPRMHARQNVVETAAWLLEYRAKHGSFPERLEQAVAKVPSDPFTDQPLKYRREGAGFVVFSVGPTGKFDAPVGPRRGQETFIRYPRSAPTSSNSLSGGPNPMPDSKVDEQAFRLAGARSGIRQERFTVARTAAEWTALWSAHNTNPDAKTPEIDFAKHDVVAYFAGSKPTGGYSVELGEVKTSGEKAEVAIVLTKPGMGTLVTQAFTQPFAMRAVPKLPPTVTHHVEQKER